MSYNVYHHDWWKCLLTPEHKIADVFVLCQFSWIPIYNTENHLPTKFWSERHQIWLFPVEQEVLLKVLQVFQVFQYQESECNPGFASAPVQWKFSQTFAASLNIEKSCMNKDNADVLSEKPVRVAVVSPFLERKW